MNWQSRDDERVARALDGTAPGAARDDQVVSLAGQLRDGADDLDAEPSFREALRERLVTAGPALLPLPRIPGERPAPPVPALPVPVEAVAFEKRPVLASAPVGAVALAPPPTQPTQPPAQPTQPPVRPRPGGRGEHAAGRRPAGRRAGPARTAIGPGRSVARPARQTLAVAVLAALALSGGLLAAITGALPGDPLYGVKRRVQGVEVALTPDEAGRGLAHLQLARNRVNELADRRTSAAPTLVATLHDMDDQTTTGVRLVAIEAVRDTDDARLAQLGSWTSQQRTLLRAASARLPGGARGEADRSLALLGTISTRVTQLRGMLRCACPVATPTDALGPLPCVDCAQLNTVAAPPTRVSPPAAARPTVAPGTRTAARPVPTTTHTAAGRPTRADPGTRPAATTAAGSSRPTTQAPVPTTVRPVPPERPQPTVDVPATAPPGVSVDGAPG